MTDPRTRRARPWPARYRLLLLVLAVVLVAAGAVVADRLSGRQVAAPPASRTSAAPPGPIPAPVTLATSTYRSSPIKAPILAVTTAGSAAPGLYLSAPQKLEASSGSTGSAFAGLLISDQAGRPVWWKPAPAGHTFSDFHVDTYRGRAVLVYFDGTVSLPGYGFFVGTWHLLDSHYQTVASIAAGGQPAADSHDLLLRPDGSAVVESYAPVTLDLSHQGGRKDATVYESRIEVVDVASGRVRSTWKSLDSIPLTDTYLDTSAAVIDYIHVNSLAVDPGHPDSVIVSGRHISAVFELDLKTGRIGWMVGGRHPTLELTNATDTLVVDGQVLPFSFQHDARLTADGTLSVYDNGDQRPVPFSRAAFFRINTAARTVTGVGDLRHEPDLYGVAQGDAERLPAGHTLVYFAGTQATAHATEFAADGTVVQEVDLPQSYRVSKQEWTGVPATAPTMSVAHTASGDAVAVSWNGATSVANWKISTGASATALKHTVVAAATGYETTIPLVAATRSAFVRATALSAGGQVLGSTTTVQITA